MSEYRIYKICDCDTDEEFIVYSRMEPNKKLNTLIRNARLGLKSKLYNFIRENEYNICVQELYDDNESYSLSLLGAKKEKLILEKKLENKKKEEYKNEILDLEEENKELLEASCDEAKAIVLSNMKSILVLNDKIFKDIKEVVLKVMCKKKKWLLSNYNRCEENLKRLSICFDEDSNEEIRKFILLEAYYAFIWKCIKHIDTIDKYDTYYSDVSQNDILENKLSVDYTPHDELNQVDLLQWDHIVMRMYYPIINNTEDIKAWLDIRNIPLFA